MSTDNKHGCCKIIVTEDVTFLPFTDARYVSYVAKAFVGD